MHQFLTLFDPPADQAVIQGHRRDQGIWREPGQRSAVRAPEGGLLILGEPGSGKTHTIVHRVAYLLTEYLAGPDQCMVITATPVDVNDRLGRLVPGLVARISVLTPHDLGLRILGDLYDRAGLKHGFRVTEMPCDVDLREDNLIAREELLTVPDALLSEDPGIADAYRRHWQWVFIDDYDHLGGAEIRLLRHIAAPGGNLTLTAAADVSGVFPGFRAVRLARDGDGRPGARKPGPQSNGAGDIGHRPRGHQLTLM